MQGLIATPDDMIYVFEKGKAPLRNYIELGRIGRNRTNVWRYAVANSFSRKTEEGNLFETHPMAKLTVMVADAILVC